MFANIIVDISHEKLDRTFQYLIPEKLENEIFPGVQVEIPFGKGNRIITGYVVEITERPEFDINKMKYISNIVKGSVALESQLIGLAWWMKQNYGSTMNQALKTVIPVKKKVKAVSIRHIRLILDDVQTKELLYSLEGKKKSVARLRLLKELLAEKYIPYSFVTDKLNVAPSTIKSLENAGVLKIETEVSYRNPVKINNAGEYNIILNDEQLQICNDIWNVIDEGRTHLIRGVTGSGKTEIYIELIDRTINQGKNVIVLIPEIALTYQTLIRFFRKFGDKVSFINSRQSAGEKHDQFEKAKKGDINIMIGPRSALFTPFSELGLIIIDEEHEGAYKSDNVPKYHAREVAIERAKMTGATVVLGSATPSVESYYKAKHGKYVLHELMNRANDSRLPEVEIVDLREELKNGNRSIISRRLDELITDRLNKNEQIMLFINRRGYAGFISCRSCGHVMKCPHCDVSLTSHYDGKLKCHYCGYEEVKPDLCPECGSKYIAAFGTGTQKIEEYVKKAYPEAKVLRMDMDTTSGKEGHANIISKFANHKADILVGTQMIVKGHDFPNVTLVGIMAADISLYAGDYTASEKTFQLITQAAGRAGRREKMGKVVVQTYNPEEYSIITAGKQDYTDFYEHEILYRKMLRYPPIMDMAVILITGADEEVLDKETIQINNTIKVFIKENDMDINVIGPASASVSKINDIYRKVIYLKGENNKDLTKIKDVVEIQYENLNKEINIYFDFSPIIKY